MSANTRIARSERHALNVRLHTAGLPTLGSAHTFGELSKAQRKALAPVRPVSTGFVHAKIVAAREAKLALATLAEFAA